MSEAKFKPEPRNHRASEVGASAGAKGGEPLDKIDKVDKKKCLVCPFGPFDKLRAVG
jgi:hypothetical protein